MVRFCDDLECKGTNKQAIYGFKNGEKLKCKKHIQSGMINLQAYFCIDDRCKENPTCASFNFSKEKKPQYCTAHKLDGMVDLSHKHRCCIHSENDIRCKKLAYYNYEGEKPKYCKVHVIDKEKMVDLVTNFCEKCETTASFKYPNETKARFCSTHAKEFPGMIDNKSKKCEDCKLIQASYNYEGLKAAYCVTCAKKRDVLMIDVRSSKCIECKKGPRIFNYIEKKPEYCSDCKKDDMIDTLSKKCIKCKKHQANFNIRGKTSTLYCRKCIEPGMINIRKKYCIYQDFNGICEYTAHYNYIGTKNPIYCGSHKNGKMIWVSDPYTLCLHEDCQENKSIATYGYMFKPKTHCFKHRLHNQITNNNPKCEGDKKSSKCKKKPLYAKGQSNLPIRCETHKHDDDKNVIEKPCKSCNLPYFLNEENNLCSNCDGSFEQYKKVKEIFIKETFDINDIEYTTWNKRIIGGCSIYRPDFVRDKDSFMIVIDIDEHQHKSYDRECEINRMIQIHQDIGLPCVFIRYNPDQYRDHNDNLIKSTAGREKILSDLVRGLSNRDPIKNPIEDSLSVYYLFYDGYDGNPQRDIINYMDNSIEEIIASLFYKPITKKSIVKSINSHFPSSNSIAPKKLIFKQRPIDPTVPTVPKKQLFLKIKEKPNNLELTNTMESILDKMVLSIPSIIESSINEQLLCDL
jgi:hypothetical protein